MMEIVAKLGIRGLVGALIGLVAVWWVEPDTAGGLGLLVAISMIVSMVVGGIISGSKKEHAKPK
jgi:hypothetical protein